MNPRVKDLILMSGLVQDESDIKMQDAERLARLIIEECLLALEPDWYGTEIEYNVEQKLYHRSANLIKRHFGIES